MTSIFEYYTKLFQRLGLLCLLAGFNIAIINEIRGEPLLERISALFILGMGILLYLYPELLANLKLKRRVKNEQKGTA